MAGITPINGAGGGSALEILDEGVSETTAALSIDFVGGGVSVTETAGAVTVNISGGGIADTDGVAEGVTNLYFTEARVLGTDLAGLSLASGADITSSSTVLSALGQLQKHVTDTDTTVSGKQSTSAKDATGGYAGLTAYKINFKDATNTYTSFFQNSNTAARTYTFPDATGTVALTSDITGTNSGTNTGDQNIFSTIAVSGQSNVVADTTSDTLTLVAGSNVTITTSAGGDSITIAATGGGSSLEILDEGVQKTAAATSIDFVGAGVAATNVGNAITVTISGAGLTDTDDLTEGASNLYFTEARVLGTDLAGLSLASGADITSSSTVLSGMGQLQKHLTDTDTTVSGKQATSAKDATGGYVGLTAYKINFKDATNTYTSFFQNSNTAARTYTFPDATGTVALTSDITGTNSGTNTGDQSIFSTIAVSGQSNVVADTTSDTLTFVAGSGMTITTSAGGDSITFAAAGGGSPVEIFDEGVSKTASVASIDFVGAGVTATNVGDAVTVTISGGGSFTEADVLATDLAGLSLASSADITSADTVLSAMGKLQAQSDLVVVGTSGVTDSHVVLFDGTSGKLIKTSGLTLSGTNTGNETTTTVGALIDGATGKTTPVDADHLGLMDSAASNILKKLSWANVKATLKTYFDTLYGALASANTWTAAQRGSVIALTDGATVALDLALGNQYSLAIAGNRTLGDPTNTVAGQTGSIEVRQDLTGSRTLAYAWPYVWVGGTAGVLTTAGCSLDQLVYEVSTSSTSTVTITIATPGVVTWNAHGLQNGQRIQLTTTGALPTGLTASTTYFVTNQSTNAFSLATTLANAAANTKITTSGSQSGTHTMVAKTVKLAMNKGWA